MIPRTLLLSVLLLVCLAQIASAAPDLCYAGKGGHLYLHSGTGADARITPDDLTDGICRMPQWVDRDKIIFVYDLSPDSMPPKTKVGVLKVSSKRIQWIAPLAGSTAIGYDMASGSIDFMRMTKQDTNSESSEVHLGQCDLKTGKANIAPAYKSWGHLTPKPIFRWPDASSRLVPVGTSDVSDQVGVYSLAKKKFVPVKWLDDKWKNASLGGWAVTAVYPSPKGMLAMAVIGDQMNCSLSIVAGTAVKKLQTTKAVIRGPVISLDGSMIAWCEDNLSEASKTIWVGPTSKAGPQKIADGWDPAWRP